MSYSNSFVFRNRGRGLFPPVFALFAFLTPQPALRAQSFIPPASHAVYVDPIHGSDINATGSPDSPYATLYKGVRAAWQNVQSEVKAAEQTLLYFDAAVQWAVGLDSLPVTTGTAAMVVDREDLIENYPDALIYVRLESLGFKVTLVTDNRVAQGFFTAEMAEAHDLLVITESAGSNNVNPLINANIPVINMRGSAWPNWFMSANPGPSQSVGTQLTILDGTSPLAADTTGTVTVYNGDWLLNHTSISALPAGANPVATLAGNPDQVCLFSIDAGTSLTAGTAPARRVGFFLFARPRTVDSVNYVFMVDNPALNPEVIVAEGTLPMDNNIQLRSRMQVRGGWDPAFQEQDPNRYITTLDGQNKTHLLEFNTWRSAYCGVQGITFTNGWRDDPVRGGGAIYMDPDGYEMWGITIDRCKFINNQSVFEGGAISVEDWNLRLSVTDSKFIGNSAPRGLVFSSGRLNRVNFERCLFADNIATTGGQAVITFHAGNYTFGDTSFIMNCVFADNQTSGTVSHIIELNGSGYGFQRLYNNTFFHNRATGEIVKDAYPESTGIAIANNLFANNTCIGEQRKPIFQPDSDAHYIYEFENNLVFGNTNYEVVNPVGNEPLIRAGINAIEGDPRLYRPALGDYRLFEGSAAIDAGMTLIQYLQMDFAGNARPQGEGFDIGAFEYTGDLLNRARSWEVYQ